MERTELIDETIDLRPYITAIIKNYRLIVACALGLALAAYLVSWLIPPVYEAEASIAIVKSGIVLNLEPKFKTDVDASAVDQAARRRSLTTIAKSLEIATAVVKKLGSSLSENERKLNTLLQAVTATNDGDLIRLKVSANSPEKAALIANAWAQEYEDRVNVVFGEATFTTTDIQPQLDLTKSEYEKAQAELVKFLSTTTVSQLERQLVQKKVDIEEFLKADGKIVGLLSDATALRKRVAASTLSSRGDELALLMLEASAFSHWSKLPGDVQLPLDQLTPNSSNSDKIRRLDTLIVALEDRHKTLQANTLPQLYQEYNQLQVKSEQENARKEELTQARELALTTYKTVANKSSEVGIATLSKSKLVRIAVPALAPEERVWPRGSLFAAVGGVVGGMIGLVIIFYRIGLTQNSKLN